MDLLPNRRRPSAGKAPGHETLTFKAPNKIAADDILIFHSYISKKIRLDRHRIHLKHQVLFSLKNYEQIFMNVVCCSRDWRFKGY